MWRHLDSEDQPYPDNLTIPAKAIVGYYRSNRDSFGDVIGIEVKSMTIKLFIDDTYVSEFSDLDWYDELSGCQLGSDEWYPSNPEAADDFKGKVTNYYYTYRTIESGHFFSIEFESDFFDPNFLNWAVVDFNGFDVAHSFKYDFPNAIEREHYGEFSGEFDVHAEVCRVES